MGRYAEIVSRDARRSALPVVERPRAGTPGGTPAVSTCSTEVFHGSSRDINWLDGAEHLEHPYFGVVATSRAGTPGGTPGTPDFDTEPSATREIAPDLIDDFEERAALMEFDGRLTRRAAERNTRREIDVIAADGMNDRSQK